MQKIADAGKFLLFLIGIALLVTVVLGRIPAVQIEQVVAETSSKILSVLGVANRTGVQTNAFIQIENGPKIIINNLCTGILETVILAAAILASFEAGWKKRIAGAAAAVAAIFVFNQIRILVTVLLILKSSVEVAVISHEIFFRIFLFVAIAGFYWVWLVWSSKKKKDKPHSKPKRVFPKVFG
ncbi:MAG: exosortase/archaeosortase family protein [Candidatus Micrarchaeota archaeon]